MTTETPQDRSDSAGGQSRAGEAEANLTDVLLRKPKTALGATLLDLRSKYIEGGGQLFSADEIDAERYNSN